MGHVPEKTRVVVYFIPKKDTVFHFGPGLLIKGKVVYRGRGEYDLFGMWQPAGTVGFQCVQFQPIIVHALGGAISLIRDLPCHFSLALARTGNDRHRIQYPMVGRGVLGGKTTDGYGNTLGVTGMAVETSGSDGSDTYDIKDLYGNKKGSIHKDDLSEVVLANAKSGGNGSSSAMNSRAGDCPKCWENYFATGAERMEEQLDILNPGRRKYGGDGSGSFHDITMKVLDEINRYNPIANLWDVITYTLTGKDRLDNEMGSLDANLTALGVIPLLKPGITIISGSASNNAISGGLNLFKRSAPWTSKASGWRVGDYFLNLANQGTPRLNWKANYGALRREMSYGKPIFDSYRLSNGELIPTNGFLNAERYILQTRGWTYSPSLGA